MVEPTLREARYKEEHMAESVDVLMSDGKAAIVVAGRGAGRAWGRRGGRGDGHGGVVRKCLQWGGFDQEGHEPRPGGVRRAEVAAGDAVARDRDREHPAAHLLHEHGGRAQPGRGEAHRAVRPREDRAAAVRGDAARMGVHRVHLVGSGCGDRPMGAGEGADRGGSNAVSPDIDGGLYHGSFIVATVGRSSSIW
eukprot:1194908-Prorocentrum_minimum.AAC.6